MAPDKRGSVDAITRKLGKLIGNITPWERGRKTPKLPPYRESDFDFKAAARRSNTPRQRLMPLKPGQRAVGDKLLILGRGQKAPSREEVTKFMKKGTDY